MFIRRAMVESRESGEPDFSYRLIVTARGQRTTPARGAPPRAPRRGAPAAAGAAGPNPTSSTSITPWAYPTYRARPNSRLVDPISGACRM